MTSGLAYAHGQGVVHRDIKPDNVLLSHGVAVVTDFGVAKALRVSAGLESLSDRPGLTSLGISLGTPAYMPPEQATSDPAMDYRVDIYAFGVTAYEMLAGQPPFSGRSPQAVLGAHLTVAPEPIALRRPGIPPALAFLIMRTLEKRAADRPQTAAEIIASLDALTTPTGGTVVIAAPAAPARPRRWKGEAAAAAMVLAGALALWGSMRRSETSTPSTSATAPAPPAVPSPDDVPPAESAAVPLDTVPAPAAAPAASPRRLPRRRPPPEPAPAVPSRGDSQVAQPPDHAPVPVATESVSPPGPPAVFRPAPAPAPPPAAVPPPDPAAQIRTLFADYGAAIEARSVDAIRRTYPGLRPEQAREWDEFFGG